MPIDALRRFTPTPFENCFRLHVATFSVATNYQLLADRLIGTLILSEDSESRPAFAWRVVVEPDDNLGVDGESPSTHYLEQKGLAFVTIGQRTFLAWDMQAKKGVGFLEKWVVESHELFEHVFLPALISPLKGFADAASRPDQCL